MAMIAPQLPPASPPPLTPEQPTAPGLRARIHRALDAPRGQAPSSISVALTVLICLNVAASVLETVEAIAARYGPWSFWFEVFSIAAFTAEYLLRLWSYQPSVTADGERRGRFAYALSPMMLVDLLAVMPAYLPFLPVDGRVLRILRVMKIFRILKLGRHSAALHLMGSVFRAKLPDLSVIVMVLVVMLLITGTLMFHAENEAQPEAFSSIPATMWWGVATLTTVGYGDIYPITPLGKMLGAVVAVLGVGLFALPAGLLAAGFNEELAKARAAEPACHCPHCGKRID